MLRRGALGSGSEYLGLKGPIAVFISSFAHGLCRHLFFCFDAKRGMADCLYGNLRVLYRSRVDTLISHVSFVDGDEVGLFWFIWTSVAPC